MADGKKVTEWRFYKIKHQITNNKGLPYDKTPYNPGNTFVTWNLYLRAFS
jgi:hypothetical protein